MATIDFAKLYSAATVKAWRLPAAASADLANGSFRGLRLVWHDLPADEAGPLSAALRFVCCDVLVLDKNATIDRPTFVFARRIELRGDAGFVLDRTSQPDIDLTWFAQSVVDQKAGAPAVLSVTVVRETGGTASLAPDYSFKTDPDAGATGMVWQPGASAACAMAAKDIDPGHLSIGEPLWLALMTTKSGIEHRTIAVGCLARAGWFDDARPCRSGQRHRRDAAGGPGRRTKHGVGTKARCDDIRVGVQGVIDGVEGP
jgi:hypothetical protein